jgi:ABC-type Mn2+/Zn2+ transport system permease subunit
VAVVLIELVKRVGQVEPGAAMGVVFTTLFAAGVLLLEQSDTSSVHLDVEHALMGNLETLIWLRPRAGGRSLDPAALAHCRQSCRAWRWPAPVMVGLTAVFWRWLKIATFDEGLCGGAGHSRGGGRLRPRDRLGAGRGRRFEAVGSIIVIAMFICPPATARLMTSRPRAQVLWSVGLRRRFGHSGLRACGLRTDVAGRGGFGQRCGNDRDGIGRAFWVLPAFSDPPPPGRSRRSGLTPDSATPDGRASRRVHGSFFREQ